MSEVFSSILDRQFVRLLILVRLYIGCFTSSKACNKARSCSSLPRRDDHDNISDDDTHASSTGDNLSSTFFLSRSETEKGKLKLFEDK